MSDSRHDSVTKNPRQTLFYVFHQGEQSGPISLVEIASQIRANKLEMNDYLYDESAGDWTFLVAHPELAELIKDVKPSVLPQPKSSGKTSPSTDGAPTEWFALKGHLRFGPFGYTEIVRLLQEKSLHDSDFVWHAGLKDWQRVLDLPDFKPDAIRRLRDSSSGQDEVFLRRRHARVRHDGSILMHNNQKVFRGTSLEISAGGAGIVLESSALDVGHQVFLHFKPASDLPPFNAVCEVVSRRPVNAADALAPIHYGVKFLKIESKTTQAIEALAIRHSLLKVS